MQNESQELELFLLRQGTDQEGKSEQAQKEEPP